MLGILPGLLGIIQATEVVKLILGKGAPLIGRLLLVDALEAIIAAIYLDGGLEPASSFIVELVMDGQMVFDREAGTDVPTRIRFMPTILPPYARRSKSLDTLIPILYLKGVSTGDFAAALAALLGKDALGLSATTIARLKDVWIDEHKQWSERDLSAKSYVYVWADGVYL